MSKRTGWGREFDEPILLPGGGNRHHQHLTELRRKTIKKV
jgi:hypothetical protein